MGKSILLGSVYCFTYLLRFQQQLGKADHCQTASAGYETTLGSGRPNTQACRKPYLSMANGMGDLDTELGR